MNQLDHRPTDDTGRRPAKGRRPDASMSLLTELVDRPLDPGYAEAAQKRRDGGEAPTVRTRTPLTILAGALVGLLLAVAGLQARGQSTERTNERSQLIQEINKQDAEANGLQRSNARLQNEIETARTDQLEAQSQGALAAQINRLSVATGAVSVAGPGITLIVNDAESVTDTSGGSDPRKDTSTDDGRVLDQDLQVVVNGLWGAGAEAVAINGQRLTALSAIRSAGQAILVDYRPLSPPYRIKAIGDPGTLQVRFSDGAGGRNLQYLKDNYGIRVSLTTSRRLTLPASGSIDVRHAVPSPSLTTGSATPTTTATTKATPNGSIHDNRIVPKMKEQLP